MSKEINRLKINDELEFCGIFGGEECLKIKKFKSLIFIAAGTGIAPFIRIISDLLDIDDDEIQIRLIYCVTDYDEIIFQNYLSNWAKHWNVSITVFVSKPSNVKPNSLPYLLKFRESRLDQNEFESIRNEVSNNVGIIVCGNHVFEKDVLNWTLKSEIDKSNFIRFTA